MNKNDLRVIKTSQNIQDTFIQLLSESEFEKITVKQLIDEAKINRSTFYKHYQDKYDLAESIASNFLEQYQSILEKRIAALDPKDQLLCVDKLYEILSEYRDTILALWKVRTEHVHISDDMQSMFKSIVHESFRKITNKELSEYQAHLLSVIVITNLRFFLENTENYKKENILSEFNLLIQFLGHMAEEIQG